MTVLATSGQYFAVHIFLIWSIYCRGKQVVSKLFGFHPLPSSSLISASASIYPLLLYSAIRSSPSHALMLLQTTAQTTYHSPLMSLGRPFQPVRHGPFSYISLYAKVARPSSIPIRLYPKSLGNQHRHQFQLRQKSDWPCYTDTGMSACCMKVAR